MTLWEFLGEMGSGKTLLATLIAIIMANKGKTVYANYKIINPSHPVNMISPEQFLDLNEKLEALVILDELYTWLESRISGSKRNRAITKIIFQSRKRGIDIIGTAQLESSIDKRFKLLTSMKVICLGSTQDGFKYGFLSGMRKPVFRYVPPNVAQKLYTMYDTREVVDYE